MKKILSIALLAACVSAAQAGPSINVGTVFDFLDGDKSTYLKRVYNSGDSTAFVRINVLEMTFDAQGKPIETPLDNEGGDAAQRKGLVASPARLIIPADGMQATRLLYLGGRDKERYYRVRYVPVVPEKEDQFAVSDEDREVYKKEMSAGVNVMTGYGAIFYVRPKETRFDTKISDQPNEYKVTNSGNSTIEIDEFKDCSSANAKDCLATRSHYILPGKGFSFTKEAGRTYTFSLFEGSQKKAIEVKK